MNGHLLRRSLAVAVMCLGLSSSARAQSAKVFFIQNGYTFCFYNQPLYPGFHILQLQAAAVGPIASARFKVVASSPVSFFNTPPNQDYDVTLSACLTGGSIPLADLFLVVPAGPPVSLSVVPATGHTAIEFTDCDGYEMSAAFEDCEYQLLGPYRPNPPDGAVNVPTDQLLSYLGDANYVALSTNPNMNIWDPANVIICNNIETGTTGPPCSLPLNPGSLAPHTTYY